MPVLPSGLSMPPLFYLIAVVAAAILVGGLLLALGPPIDQRLVVALAPWMAVGGALHAFYQLSLEFDIYPPFWEPLFGAPTVYLTAFVLTGVVWVVLAVVGISRGSPETISRNLGLTGTGVLTVLFGFAVYQGVGFGTLSLVLPAIALVASLAGAALVTLAMALWRTPIFFRVRYAGPTVVFAHALDGISTAIGADVVGASERSPLPRAILEFAGTLPTAETFGVGWLFIVVKLLVATVIVVAFHSYLDEEPTEGTLLLSLVTAVGLGPAANNLFLFLVGV